jgi:hypothetical protein
MASLGGIKRKERAMAKSGRWAIWVSVGALASACQVELDGRACGVSDRGEENECLDGWSCCPGNVCQRECSSDSTDTGEMSGMTDGADTGASPSGLVVVDLPVPLPRAREAVSRVYSLASRETVFEEPVTIEVPVDASALSHLMVLKLSDGWQPVEGATFTPVEPTGGADAGTVKWTTEQGGIFVVVALQFLMAIDTVLGQSPYSYSCDQSQTTIGVPGENGGVGPFLDTANASANNPDCPWPGSNPRLSLEVLLRGFLPSEGPLVGTWDLAAPETIFPLRLSFSSGLQDEVPVGQDNPYQYYESTAPLAGAESPPSAPYEGFYQSPLARGFVTVSRLPTVANTGRAGDSVNADGFTGFYVIDVTDVTLSADGSALPAPIEPFPPTVTISSATLSFAF